ncbi:hypothetical protein, partial [Pantoea ananatis]|uniref:hypothetical protein n=1 Tax=Pantoea ananas TaxID=553 RepID=UPI0023B123D2
LLFGTALSVGAALLFGTALSVGAALLFGTALLFGAALLFGTILLSARGVSAEAGMTHSTAEREPASIDC